MTDPPVTDYRLNRRATPFCFYIEGPCPPKIGRFAMTYRRGKTTFSLNRMKILKKSLPSEKLSTTLARLDRQNMFEEIR
ncbi:hypothetical protein JFT86_28940 [Pseudomonas sp. TH06]|uniref:hypothetical protein n=1 Tax=Pseudomonas sp. TH06 TaxID=2796372 RepID=UPI001913E7B4|nr:hypothetical protein [Pseudomonas sp. TH06]MBK5530967.1 hypothetical protein [Pseudomonas sp. TH06]